MLSNDNIPRIFVHFFKNWVRVVGMISTVAEIVCPDKIDYNQCKINPSHLRTKV